MRAVIVIDTLGWLNEIDAVLMTLWSVGVVKKDCCLFVVL